MTEITGPTGDRCQTSFAGSLPAASAGGGQLQVGVTAARECSWTVSSEAGWIRVSPASGQGEATLTLTVDPNNSARPRQGAILLNDTRALIAQEPAPCRFELSRSGARVPFGGGSASVDVRAPDGCEWSASSAASWIRVRTASGAGAGTMLAEIDANGGAARSATITIAAQPFTISQDAAPPSPTPPAPAPPSPTPPAPTPPSPTPPAPTPPAPTPPAPTPPAPTPPAPTPPAPTPPAPTPPSPSPPAPTPVEDVKVEGRVSQLIGQCPAIEFRVRNYRIAADARTKFDKGDCSSIRERTQVRVEGTLLSNGIVLAKEIRREDDDDDDDDDNSGDHRPGGGAW